MVRHKKLITLRRTEQSRLNFAGSMRKTLTIIVRDHSTNEELGSAKIPVDDLIDPELRDLAQEHCMCISRADIRKAKIEKLEKSGVTPEDAAKQLTMFSEYAGIVRI